MDEPSEPGRATAETRSGATGSDTRTILAPGIMGPTRPLDVSVLVSLWPDDGEAPRVALRTPSEVASPDDRPPPSAEATTVAGPERYRIFEEIARGGMGAILLGRDNDLGRDLAIKVLRETHADDPEWRRRFVEEAQIGGQLQHPAFHSPRLAAPRPHDISSDPARLG